MQWYTDVRISRQNDIPWFEGTIRENNLHDIKHKNDLKRVKYNRIHGHFNVIFLT